MGGNVANRKEHAKISTRSPLPSGKESHKFLDSVDAENTISFSGSNVGVSCPDSSVDAMKQADLPGFLSNSGTMGGKDYPPMNKKLSEQIYIESAMSAASASQQAASDVTHQSLVDRSASRFFWPSAEKKLLDVPRERCGWCYSCKAPASSRRGCMLNSAVSTATRSANKILIGLPILKNGEGSLPSIATYIVYMEEGLRGFVTGPFLSPSYRKQWRSKMEEASTCSAIKALLLELEENISVIALLVDWIKLMDDWLVDSSVIQSTSFTVGLPQKRGPGGRRRRKQSVASEVTADDCDDKSFDWWRGGKLSTHIFQKAILPGSMVRKAAQQGGVRKISGINYVDDSEIPKRSRQLIWRAAVERSKNAAQLALQVRYLDLHVRWNDLVRPEHNIPDGKGMQSSVGLAKCYHAKVLGQNEISTKSPIIPLPLQGRDCLSAPAVTKGMQVKSSAQPIKPLASIRSKENSVRIQERSSDTKQSASLSGLATKRKWYHAEAVELEESRISDLVGFKCCKCRRIRGPECPYMDPELREQRRKKRLGKPQKQGQGSVVLDSDFGTISNFKECKPITRNVSTEHELVSANDPLLFSLSKVEQITENNSEVDVEWNTASGPGLQKLPVRRHVKREEVDGHAGGDLGHVELSSWPEPSNYTEPKEDTSLTFAEWDVSGNGLESELLFDYESLNYEDMEFEPQTYFSFTELLASDDGGQVDGHDATGDGSRNLENASGSISQDGVPEHRGTDTFSSQVEPMISENSDVNAPHCHVCLQNNPAPELYCDICGFLMHSHCSPWDELSSSEGGSWRCGRCREWR
ncbi:hypothetical protein SCA6_010455 [Theobroma cacao]